MKVAIESSYCDYDRNLRNLWFGQRCMESIVEYDERLGIISKYDT